MLASLKLLWTEQEGVLAFEWTMLLTLLVIGIVSGVSAARDAIIDELGDTAQVMLAVDQSYSIDFPLEVSVHTSDTSSSTDSSFTDAFIYYDCERTDRAIDPNDPFGGAGVPTQGPSTDSNPPDDEPVGP